MKKQTKNKFYTKVMIGTRGPIIVKHKTKSEQTQWEKAMKKHKDIGYKKLESGKIVDGKGISSKRKKK